MSDLHTESVRQHDLLSQLDSSEAAPSEYSSVYNAAVSHGRSSTIQHSSGSDKDGEQRFPSLDSGHSKLQADQLQSPRQMMGTQLFTITEQNSKSTLQTKPSTWTIEQRRVSLQPPMDELYGAGTARGVQRGRRQCVSLNASVVLKLHRLVSVSQTTSAGHGSRTGSNDRSPEGSVPEAMAPPFAPPTRVPTPDGVPH